MYKYFIAYTYITITHEREFGNTIYIDSRDINAITAEQADKFLEDAAANISKNFYCTDFVILNIVKLENF